MRLRIASFLTVAIVLGIGAGIAPSHDANTPSKPTTLQQFGLVGDGKTDDTNAMQRAVDAGLGQIHLPKGNYRLTQPIVVDLDRVGPTSITSDATATITMAGPGPALRFQGTHGGTAAPSTVKANVWERQRMPLVEGLEIVGDHAEANGIEADGTMQITITRCLVRKVVDAIRLTGRNRNVIIADCHLYENRGVGVFMDRLNLHQINITGSHVSYNQRGGIVAKKSEIRNLHIGTCDIEGNMGGRDSIPSANIELDSTDSSIGEVAIVGCTIQHTHDAPNSANIRINGKSNPVRHTDERRHGNITIADNILSDVQINIDIERCRAVTITGNTMWKGYERDLIARHCSNLVVGNNVFDRNPRYHYADGSGAKHGVVFENCSNATIIGNHIAGVGDIEAAMVARRCRLLNIVGCTIVGFGKCGLLLDDVRTSRVSDCLIRDDEAENDAISIKVVGGAGNMIVDNLVSHPDTSK
ncbi:Pectate lyase superfamily protein [Planctomycetes bacterium Pan216]|uniref:Pectate lyase superfamily protein n=1 Tax=Kolteria novifilia TaxID=2527975 RepID=A0A518B8H5_9BACT|nr:Pectate lyase superfamily protein [Planctomycetes bacterium Pan216]